LILISAASVIVGGVTVKESHTEVFVVYWCSRTIRAHTAGNSEQIIVNTLISMLHIKQLLLVLHQINTKLYLFMIIYKFNSMFKF
jgi:hypothetical protein